MADPVTVFSIITGSAGLVLQCGKIFKDLHQLVEQYKSAQLTILSMTGYLETVQWAWRRISSVVDHWTAEDIDQDFLDQIYRRLQCGKFVMSALEYDLQNFQSSSTTDSFSFRKRTKFVWNEGVLKDHRERLRDQVEAMNLFNSAIQITKQIDRKDYLNLGQELLRKCDESAYIIVPSKASRSVHHNDSTSSHESQASLVYQELSIDDDLFTARVYKRNYRSPLIRELLYKANRVPAEDASSSSSRRQPLQRRKDSKVANMSSATISSVETEEIDSIRSDSILSHSVFDYQGEMRMQPEGDSNGEDNTNTTVNPTFDDVQYDFSVLNTFLGPASLSKCQETDLNYEPVEWAIGNSTFSGPPLPVPPVFNWLRSRRKNNGRNHVVLDMPAVIRHNSGFIFQLLSDRYKPISLVWLQRCLEAAWVMGNEVLVRLLLCGNLKVKFEFEPRLAGLLVIFSNNGIESDQRLSKVRQNAKSFEFHNRFSAEKLKTNDILMIEILIKNQSYEGDGCKAAIESVCHCAHTSLISVLLDCFGNTDLHQNAILKHLSAHLTWVEWLSALVPHYVSKHKDLLGAGTLRIKRQCENNHEDFNPLPLYIWATDPVNRRNITETVDSHLIIPETGLSDLLSWFPEELRSLEVKWWLEKTFEAALEHRTQTTPLYHGLRFSSPQ